MTLADPYERHSLNFLREGTGSDFTKWGHEYNLQLSGDIADEFGEKLEKNEDLTVSLFPNLLATDYSCRESSEVFRGQRIFD